MILEGVSCSLTFSAFVTIELHAMFCCRKSSMGQSSVILVDSKRLSGDWLSAAALILDLLFNNLTPQLLGSRGL